MACARLRRRRLRQGLGLDVAPDSRRQFRVRAGRAEVLVVGTRFIVRRQGWRSEVAVERGRVRVFWTDGSAVLSGGQCGWFPPEDVSPPSKGSGATVSAEGTKITPTCEAVAALEPADVDPDEASLMREADAQRKAGHPAASVAYLEQVIRQRGPRGARAAHILGRVELYELGHPAQAAQAFATAYRLAPNAALSEDALSNEVEALAGAGRPVLRFAPGSNR